MTQEDANTVNQHETAPATDHATSDSADNQEVAEASQTDTPDNGTSADPAAEYLAGWQRTRAEFANYKKRVERELKESQQKGALNALAHILPIIDDFERALENVPDDLKDHPWVSGTSLLLPKLHKLLSEYDVERIDPVGEMFDPTRHEAIGMDDSGEHESGRVTQTLQKGYISGDRVIRPALVRVAN